LIDRAHATLVSRWTGRQGRRHRRVDWIGGGWRSNFLAFGGGDTFVDTLVITKADAGKIKGQLSAGKTVNVTVFSECVHSIGSQRGGRFCPWAELQFLTRSSRTLARRGASVPPK